MGKQWKQWQSLFFWAPKSPQMVIAAMKLKDVYSLEEKLWPSLDSILKSRDITLLAKVRLVKAMIFSSSHVWMWELDSKEGWTPENWCFWAMVLVKTLESPLDCKEIKPVNPKKNQPWIFIGRNEAEAVILWPPDEKSQLIGKDPGAGKDWRQEVKGVTEDEMAGWHHRLDGHEFEQTPRDSEGQRSLACCTPWDHKKSDMAEWLNNNYLIWR